MDKVDFICQKCKKPIVIDTSIATKRKDEPLTWETKALPADFKSEDVEAILLKLDHIAEPTRSPVRKRDNEKPSVSSATPAASAPVSAPVAVAPPVNNELLKAMDLAMGCEAAHNRAPAASFSAASYSGAGAGSGRKLLPPPTANASVARSLAPRRPGETPDTPGTPETMRVASLVHCTREEQLQLFDRAGEQTPGIDHPLCRECGIGYLKELLRDLQEMETTNAAYTTALNALAAVQAPATKEPSGLDLSEEERKLLEREAQLDAQLAEIERSKLESQPRQTLAKTEEWFVQRVARADYEAQVLREQHASLTSIAAHTEVLLTDLKSTNILNHVFHIWFDGYFGTINGMRLGRLASQPVDWTEINAAWGETVLLLTTMARHLKLTFKTCTPVPLGNTSRVEFPDKSVCELYGSSDLSLGKFFWGRRYDAAIVGVLACVKELADHTKGAELPYKYVDDKVLRQRRNSQRPFFFFQHRCFCRQDWPYWWRESECKICVL